MKAERRNVSKWKNLFLVRHGESTCNAVNRFAGAVDAPLTRLGEAQATKAAKQWNGGVPDRIYASPLKRACRTAEIIFPSLGKETNAGQELVIDARISERDFGDFTLENKSSVQRQIGLDHYETALYGDSLDMARGESFSHFHERVLKFLCDELHPLLVAGKKVVVVAHKYVIELLSRLILRLPVVGGFDLRLPNAKLLNGADLCLYLKNEYRSLNHARDWVVLHYAQVLLFGVVVGLLLNRVGVVIPGSSFLGLVLLGAATGLSLATVDLGNIRPHQVMQSVPFPQVVVRYLLLPVGLGTIGYLYAQDPWLLALALFLASPAAVTGITISRCLGGLILPSVHIILLSSLLGAASTFLVVQLYGMHNLATPLGAYLAITGMALLLPLLVARYMRQRFPIGTARFAERNAAWAVILLTLFVVLAFQRVDVMSFWPYGIWAVLIALSLRVVAFMLARHHTLHAVDDYIAMANPNIFLVLMLATSLGLEELLPTCAWFLLPMFALIPLDQWLTRQMSPDKADARMLSFLRITSYGQATELGSEKASRSASVAAAGTFATR